MRHPFPPSDGNRLRGEVIANGRQSGRVCVWRPRDKRPSSPLGGYDRYPGSFQGRLPELLPADSGLKDVAELCKRDFAARPARDWNDVRDQLLLIGVEWNLAAIGSTSSRMRACARIATFLR